MTDEGYPEQGDEQSAHNALVQNDEREQFQGLTYQLIGWAIALVALTMTLRLW